MYPDKKSEVAEGIPQSELDLVKVFQYLYIISIKAPRNKWNIFDNALDSQISGGLLCGW